MADRPHLAWLAAAAAVALVLPSRLSIPLAVGLLTVLGLDRWVARRAVRGLEVGCSVVERADFDHLLYAHVVVRNPARVTAAWVELDVPCSMGLGRSVPHRELLTMAPGETREIRVRLRTTQRGRQSVGPATVRVGQVLGVAEPRLRSSSKRAAVTVFPRIVSLADLTLPAEFPFVELPNRRSLITDPSSAVGVRDYQPGDPLSAVHWPATARANRLLVKEHERGESRDTIVCLDLSRTGYPFGQLRSTGELAITVAASVAWHTIMVQRLSAGLRIANASGHDAVDVPARCDPRHLRSLLEVLAVAELGVGQPLASLLSGVGAGLGTGTTLLVVTGTMTPEVAAHLLRLRRQGVAVTAALTADGPQDTVTPGHLWLPVYRVRDVTGVAGLTA